MPKMTEGELERLAIDTLTRKLREADVTRAAMERAAQLLDYVQTYNWLLPHSDEFTAKLLEHAKWIDRERIRGAYPPGNTIKRPVSKPKLRKSSIGDIRKSRRSPTCTCGGIEDGRHAPHCRRRK